MSSIIAAIVSGLAVLLVYIRFSVRMIHSNDMALVERLGKYNRQLEPGINFVIPLFEKIVCRYSRAEQILNVPPQEAITKDNVYITIDAVVYWQVMDLEKAYYNIDRLEAALESLMNTTLRAEIGRMNLEDAVSSTKDINKILLEQVDEITANWGVKVTRVQVEHLELPSDVRESMAAQQAAEINKRATLSQAQATAASIEEILKVLGTHFSELPSGREILKFLVAKRYVEAASELSQSQNSKIIFMDPKALTQTLEEMLETGDVSALGSAPPTQNVEAQTQQPTQGPTQQQTQQQPSTPPTQSQGQATTQSQSPSPSPPSQPE
jgi:regulator of protease activity HflC (stomatin/prohibitin superfamily)